MRPKCLKHEHAFVVCFLFLDILFFSVSSQLLCVALLLFYTLICNIHMLFGICHMRHAMSASCLEQKQQHYKPKGNCIFYTHTFHFAIHFHCIFHFILTFLRSFSTTWGCKRPQVGRESTEQAAATTSMSTARIGSAIGEQPAFLSMRADRFDSTFQPFSSLVRKDCCYILYSKVDCDWGSEKLNALQNDFSALKLETASNSWTKNNNTKFTTNPQIQQVNEHNPAKVDILSRVLMRIKCLRQQQRQRGAEK
uniref:Uncharacterized protein n=1 Tax=Ceratitis capitata TaxID=7213 RepID=W8BLJ5_CERCA